MPTDSTTASFHYKSRGRPFDPRWRFLTGFSNPRRFLDLGCGSGQTSGHVLKMYPGIELLGVDVGPTGPENLRYTQLDLNREDLPYESESIDGVMMNHVLEHLVSPLHVVGEIRRVLAPGGAVYIEAPNWTSALVPSFGYLRGHQVAPTNFFDDPTHIRPWSKHGIHSLLNDYGKLRVLASGVKRSWLKAPLDLARVPVDLITGAPPRSFRQFWWNLVGWACFAVAQKGT